MLQHETASLFSVALYLLRSLSTFDYNTIVINIAFVIVLSTYIATAMLTYLSGASRPHGGMTALPCTALLKTIISHNPVHQVSLG